MEMVPGEVAAKVTEALTIPTIGIGAGPDCDAQVLVWQDMAGLRTGKMATFVKQYADLHGSLLKAAQDYAADVASGDFPWARAHLLTEPARGGSGPELAGQDLAGIGQRGAVPREMATGDESSRHRERLGSVVGGEGVGLVG